MTIKSTLYPRESVALGIHRNVLLLHLFEQEMDCAPLASSCATCHGQVEETRLRRSKNDPRSAEDLKLAPIDHRPHRTSALLGRAAGWVAVSAPRDEGLAAIDVPQHSCWRHCLAPLHCACNAPTPLRNAPSPRWQHRHGRPEPIQRKELLRKGLRG